MELIEKIKEKNDVISNLVKENKGWSEKVARLEEVLAISPQDFDTMTKLHKKVRLLEEEKSIFEKENLMLKLGNAKLSSDLKNAMVSAKLNEI